MARFPFQKTLESFDFKFQPSIDPKQIRELATGRYIQSGDNLLLLGPPGVGKTHLAVALGIKACEQGVRTLFVTATALITTLGKALAEGKLDERLKLLSSAAALNLRRDRLSADRPPGRQPVLPAGLAPLRARLDHHHQQSESRRLGRGLRRYRHRQRDPRPPAAPFDHDQHQRGKLPAQGEAQGRPAQAQTRNAIELHESSGLLRGVARGDAPSHSPKRTGLTRGGSFK